MFQQFFDSFVSFLSFYFHISSYKFMANLLEVILMILLGLYVRIGADSLLF